MTGFTADPGTLPGLLRFRHNQVGSAQTLLIATHTWAGKHTNTNKPPEERNKTKFCFPFNLEELFPHVKKKNMLTVR